MSNFFLLEKTEKVRAKVLPGNTHGRIFVLLKKEERAKDEDRAIVLAGNPHTPVGGSSVRVNRWKVTPAAKPPQNCSKFSINFNSFQWDQVTRPPELQQIISAHNPDRSTSDNITTRHLLFINTARRFPPNLIRCHTYLIKKKISK